MIALLLAAAQVVPAPSPAPPVPPTDLALVPPLPWRVEPVMTPELTAFVANEVRGGRCAAEPGKLVEVRVAAFVRSDGVVGATVPGAIACPRVEQFAAGLVTSFARNNLRMPAGGWYQTVMSFAWDR